MLGCSPVSFALWAGLLPCNSVLMPTRDWGRAQVGAPRGLQQPLPPGRPPRASAAILVQLVSSGTLQLPRGSGGLWAGGGLRGRPVGRAGMLGAAGWRAAVRKEL